MKLLRIGPSCNEILLSIISVFLLLPVVGRLNSELGFMFFIIMF
jgi:hypothetical protein